MTGEWVEGSGGHSVKREDLEGADVLITGSNAGLGWEMSRLALAAGARLHFTCRTQQSVAETEAALRREFPDAVLRGYSLEFASLDDVDDFCDQLERVGTPIDCLILNAGLHVPFRDLTTGDGFELHHQVNFLSAVLIFLRLCDRSQDPPRRVVYVSSDAHKIGHVPQIFPLTFWSRYARSKLWATTFFCAARPLFPSTVISVLSPGDVATSVHRYKPPLVRWLRSVLGRAQASEEAAIRLFAAVFSSSRPEAYRNRGRPSRMASRCLRDDFMLRVWNETSDTLFLRGSLRGYAPLHVQRNHAGTVFHLAPKVHTPRNEDEVVKLVRAASETGRRIRVAGSRHSYNACFYSPSVSVSLERFTEVGPIDDEALTVKVGAGVTLRRLCNYLDDHGYALRHAGSHGQQTAIGAALTGTHGYCREGGLIAELIVALRVVTGQGQVVSITDEEELRSFRVSLGALGIVTSATFSVERKDRFVEYSLSTLDERTLIDRLGRDTSENEHYRFFRNRYHPQYYTVLTINPAVSVGFPDQHRRPRPIEDRSPPRLLVSALRYLLRSRSVHRLLRPLPAFKLEMRLVFPYSTLLFLNGGVVDRAFWLSGLLYHAWTDDTTHNMEVAIRPGDLEAFLDVFDSLAAVLEKRVGECGAYFTARFVGRSTKAILAPNYGRDVLFLDVHVSRGGAGNDFLAQLERGLREAMPVRPHWGKEFFMDHAQLEEQYPSESWRTFRTMRLKYDPGGVFVNEFTRRVLGVGSSTDGPIPWLRVSAEGD